MTRPIQQRVQDQVRWAANKLVRDQVRWLVVDRAQEQVEWPVTEEQKYGRVWWLAWQEMQS